MLVKEQAINMVEVNALGVVQVQVSTTISDDGVAMPPQYSRYCITPGEDYTTEPDLVKNICAVVHTEEAIATYLATVMTGRMEAAESVSANLVSK